MHLSPRFTLEDWNFGKCSDLDVAEDQLSGWVFGPARRLADNPDAGIAILAIVTPYFELIRSYHTGESARERADEFLKGGLELVFPAVSDAAREAYVHHVRFGFLQGGLFRRAWLHHGHASFPDFELLPDGKTLSINPWYVLDTAEAHFRAWFTALREGADPVARNTFDKVMTVRKKS